MLKKASIVSRTSDDAVGFTARVEVGESTTLLKMSPEGVIDTFRRYNEMVGEIAQEQGTYLADVRSAVPSGGQYFGDHTHFTPQGSELAAQEIAAVIIEAER